MFAMTRQGSARLSRRTGNWLAFGVSTLLCLGLIEVVLRTLALKLPPGVAIEEVRDRSLNELFLAGELDAINRERMPRLHHRPLLRLRMQK